MGKRINNSEVLRNIFLFVGGFFALALAYWRSNTADKHQKTANRQQKKEARARLDERFQQGSNMLGHKDAVVRMSGITILERLSKEKPKKFQMQVVNLLGNFIKHPRRDKHKLAIAELQEALKAIGRISSNQARVDLSRTILPVDVSGSNLDSIRLNQGNFERVNLWRSTFKKAVIDNSTFARAILSKTNFDKASLVDVDFSDSTLLLASINDAKLQNVKFKNTKLVNAKLMRSKFKGANFVNSNADFSQFRDSSLIAANFSGASLEKANFLKANLTNADFTNASLIGADLRQTNLESADFRDADLSGANLLGVSNLTQDQLDVACQSSDSPPKLDKCFGWNKFFASKRYDVSRGPTYYWRIVRITGWVEGHRTPREQYNTPQRGDNVTVNEISVKVIGIVSSEVTSNITIFAEEV